MTQVLARGDAIPDYLLQLHADQRSAEGWLTLTEAADQLHMSGITLRLAIERGAKPSIRWQMGLGSSTVARWKRQRQLGWLSGYGGNVETPY